jgi:multidrug efflux pump
VQLEVDRKQANALGVSFADIGNVLSTAVGSTYVNDFPNQGRMQRVVVQAEGDQRSQVEDLLKMHVRNNAGTWCRCRRSSRPNGPKARRS